jgi:citrate synthase
LLDPTANPDEPLRGQEQRSAAHITHHLELNVDWIIGYAFAMASFDLDLLITTTRLMFSVPYADYELKPDVVRALDLIFLLHADHEQNCSTSTVRMVASSKANLFASVASGVCALWGPLHGGANQAVLEMLEQIHRDSDTYPSINAKTHNFLISNFFRRRNRGHALMNN